MSWLACLIALFAPLTLSQRLAALARMICEEVIATVPIAIAEWEALTGEYQL